MILLLLSCGDPPMHVLPSDDEPVVVEEVWTELPAPRLYRRMHLDLTGALPDVEDLDALAADPSSLEERRDAVLDDPRVEERLVVLLGERWATQIDEFMYEYEEYGDFIEAGVAEYTWERTVANEPLRLMARIAVGDRPWTDIVTADTTMANELIAVEWPVDYPAGETGWHEVRYTDGRPGAGVLSSNGLWLRYTTTITNYNRGRAAMLSDHLVCEDFFGRPIDLSEAASVSDGDDLEEALQTTPHCQGCHSTIDPIAASLFGFYAADQRSQVEHEVYHAEREELGEELLDVEMAWFGEPVSSLEDLGVTIANDPRFDGCAVESWAQLLWRRTVTPDDGARLDALRLEFVDADRRVMPLLAAIQDTPEYRAGALPEHRLEGDEVVVRQMPPQLLSDAVESLTGFRWFHEDFDQLDNSVMGYRTLGGGADGEYVSVSQQVPSATQMLVVRRLSEAAAGHAIDTGTLSPPSGDVEAWITALYWQATARELADEDLAALVGLYDAVQAHSGDDEAAAAIVSAILQDPEFWTW
ncbi:MAG: hypothetical protein GY913_06605 [Proteobacteria bacterium]|nr:hypothetical protein [Pseudomonadota bacterium]MCP4916576.1 hypothetical protein [Pseudomonadota bacterium]